MSKIKYYLLLCLFISITTNAANGLITIKSNHSVKQTSKKLVKILKKKGMTVFKVINHTKGAKKVKKQLRPTTVVIFGNPKIGTILMNCAQTVAIDLPQKALIWQDGKGQVWYSYNDPQYLKNRHEINGCEGPIKKITGALAKFAKAATK